MWTPQNRKRYDRSRLRYPSDLTDEEWAHIAPLIPPAKPGGNKRTGTSKNRTGAGRANQIPVLPDDRPRGMPWVSWASTIWTAV